MPKPNSSDSEDSIVKDVDLHNSSSFELDSTLSHSSDYMSLSDQSMLSDEGSSVDHVGYDDELCICEQGGSVKKAIYGTGASRTNSSVDTGSLTNEPSLTSSFSSDAQDHIVECSSRIANGESPIRIGENRSVSLLNQLEVLSQESAENTYRGDLFESLRTGPLKASQLRQRRDFESSKDSSYMQAIADKVGETNGSENNNNGLSPTPKNKAHISLLIHGNSENGFKNFAQSIRIPFSLWCLVSLFCYNAFSVYHGNNSSGALGVTRWSMPTERQARKLIRKIKNRSFAHRQRRVLAADSSLGTSNSAGSISKDGFVLRLRGSRVDLLQRSIDQHASCGIVQEIQIDWQPNHSVEYDHLRKFNAYDEEFPDQILQHSSKKVVKINSAEVNKQSDSVLLLKEGVALTCLELERAYYEWKLDPTRVVGFFPEYHQVQGDSTSSSYSLVSDDAIFVHRLYLSNKSMLAIQKNMQKNDNGCQHLAISAFVSAVSSRSALVIDSWQQSQQGKKQKRTSSCIPRLLQAAGMKLIPIFPTKFVGQYSDETL